MSNKKFVYKLDAADKLIISVILLTFILFGGLLYLDSYFSDKRQRNSSSPAIQNLVEERDRLQAELDRVLNEGESN